MSEQVDIPGLAAAGQQIDALCVKVGLARVNDLPHVEGSPQSSKGAMLWAADYARLLLWPCRGSDILSIEAAAREGQNWFDEVLVQGERRTWGRTIDGYLVLALPAAPDDSTREEIRKLELSTQVCRKHLIWPSADGDVDHEPDRWRRIADVTVLGLPDAEAAPGPELQWPVIDTEAQALWDDLVELGVTHTVNKDEAA